MEWREEIVIWNKTFFCTKVPVTQKKILQVVYTRSFNHHMGIAPVKFAWVVGMIDITVAHIDASDKANLTIHHNYLSVITVIETVGKHQEIYFIERKCLHAGFS